MKRKLSLHLITVMLAVVIVAASSVCIHAASISAKKLTLEKGESASLKVSGVKVKWSSSKASVAAVSSKGKVKAKKPGKAKITARKGNRKWTCTVTVKKASGGMTPYEKKLYKKLMGFKKRYPEKTRWNNDVEYRWKGGLYAVSCGCDAFATRLSDELFGDVPARMLKSVPKKLRPGDIIRMENDTHSVIVLRMKGKDVEVAEGNYIFRGIGGGVHWGRKIGPKELKKHFTYLLTRY